MEHAIPMLPVLETLDQHPSWCNRNGKVDRSACFVLTAKWADLFTCGEYHPARSMSGRFGYAAVELAPSMLEQVWARDPERQVRGDFRRWSYATRRVNMAWEDRVGPRTGYDAIGVHRNPNRGPERQKTLALRRSWSQRVAVERWYYLSVRPDGYVRHVRRWDTAPERWTTYLVCPGCHGSPDAPHWPLPVQPAANVRDMTTAQMRQAKLSLLNPLYRYDDRRLCDKGRGHARRVMKLYLPLATEREFKDAQAAQLWLDICANRRRDPAFRGRGHNAPGTHMEAILHARYGPLFHPRRLLCSACLGLKWGALDLNQLPPELWWMGPKTERMRGTRLQLAVHYLHRAQQRGDRAMVRSWLAKVRALQKAERMKTHWTRVLDELA